MNYTGNARTNYFKVTDEEAFRDLIGRTTTDSENMRIFESDRGDGRFGFGGYGTVSGTWEKGAERGPEWEGFSDGDDLLIEELQKLLPDGEACILTETGHEGLRYLTGYATVITNSDVQTVSLESKALELARQMLGDKDWTTRNEY